MSKNVALSREELSEHANMTKLISEKHNDGVRKIRAEISELENVLKGGQGDAVINALVDLSKTVDVIQNINETLATKLAGKVSNVSIMEDKTGQYKAIQDKFAAASAAAKNAQV